MSGTTLSGDALAGLGAPAGRRNLVPGLGAKTGSTGRFDGLDGLDAVEPIELFESGSNPYYIRALNIPYKSSDSTYINILKINY
jgi:hypothetical protein